MLRTLNEHNLYLTGIIGSDCQLSSLDPSTDGDRPTDGLRMGDAPAPAPAGTGTGAESDSDSDESDDEEDLKA